MVFPLPYYFEFTHNPMSFHLAYGKPSCVAHLWYSYLKIVIVYFCFNKNMD